MISVNTWTHTSAFRKSKDGIEGFRNPSHTASQDCEALRTSSVVLRREREAKHLDLSMKTGPCWLSPRPCGSRNSFREREVRGLPQADALFFSSHQKLARHMPDRCRTLRICKEINPRCVQIEAPEKEKSALTVRFISARVCPAEFSIAMYVNALTCVRGYEFEDLN